MLQVVNEKDTVLDVKSRIECHEGKGLLHRATTVLLTNNQGQLLITKRSNKKDLWPGFWDTTASTHPSEFESYIDAAKRSLKTELGIKLELKQIDKFTYQADFNKTKAENEMCALFTGIYTGKLFPNQNEISEFTWISIDDLKKEIELKNNVSPWLVHAFNGYLKYTKSKI